MFPVFMPAAIQIDYFPFGRLIGPFVTLLSLTLILVRNLKSSLLTLRVRDTPISGVLSILILLIATFNSLSSTNMLIGTGKIVLSFSLFFLSRWYVLVLRDRGNLSSSILIVPAVLVVSDVVYRVSLTNYDSFLSNFYVFKTESMMFFDSNAAAMYIACWLFVALGMLHSKAVIRSRGIYVGIALFLVAMLLTLSRAAILATLIALAVSLSLNSRNAAIRALVGISLLVGLVVAGAFIPILVSLDGSFLGKIMIYEELYDYFVSPQTGALALLFGVGMVDGIYEISYIPGFHSHTLVSTLVGQVGIIGLASYFLWFFCEGVRSGYWFIGLFIFIFVSGLSYTNPFYETFFLALGILSALSWQPEKQA